MARSMKMQNITIKHELEGTQGGAGPIALPPVPADLDLRGYPYMPLFMAIRNADITIHASGEAFRANMLLRVACWHQIPATSLPADDKALAYHAGYGRNLKAFRKVKSEALSGFVECADGRLYLMEMVDHALELAEKKRSDRRRTAAATQARWPATSAEPNHLRDAVGNGEQQNQTETKSKETKQATTPQHTNQPTTPQASDEGRVARCKRIILEEFRAASERAPEKNQVQHPHNLSSVEDWPESWSEEVIRDQTRYALQQGISRGQPIQSVDYLKLVIAGYYRERAAKRSTNREQ
jgi:hypothetical protein